MQPSSNLVSKAISYAAVLEVATSDVMLISSQHHPSAAAPHAFHAGGARWTWIEKTNMADFVYEYGLVFYGCGEAFARASTSITYQDLKVLNRQALLFDVSAPAHAARRNPQAMGQKFYLVVAFCAVTDPKFTTHNFHDNTVRLQGLAGMWVRSKQCDCPHGGCSFTHLISQPFQTFVTTNINGLN